MSDMTLLPPRYYVSLLKRVDGDNAEKYQEAMEYLNNNPVKQFCMDAKDPLRPQDVINKINDTIIHILDDIIRNDLEIDVALCRLLVLVDYTNHDMHQMSPFIWRTYCIEYIAFLSYFVVGSCLPKSSRKRISMHNISNIDIAEYNTIVLRNSVILQALMNDYFPQFQISQFKYSVPLKEVISISVQGYIANDSLFESGISGIIVEFVQFDFYEFLRCFNDLLARVSSETGTYYHEMWVRFVSNYDGGGIDPFPPPLPRLLVCDKFIEHKHDRLKLEAHHLAFQQISYVQPYKRHRFINKYFVSFPVMRCYSNPTQFIELFEAHLYGCNVLQSLKHSLLCERAPLTIFHNGNTTEYSQDVQNIYYDAIHYRRTLNNVEYIFKEFIDNQYLRNECAIMHNLLFQLMNCYIYYMSLTEHKSNGKLQLVLLLSLHIRDECKKYCFKQSDAKYIGALNAWNQFQCNREPPRKKPRLV